MGAKQVEKWNEKKIFFITVKFVQMEKNCLLGLENDLGLMLFALYKALLIYVF